MNKRFFSYATAVGLFALPIVFSAQAREGAQRGFALWTGLLVPSLLPCFVAAGLLVRLGFAAALGRRLSPVAGRWFEVSAAGFGVLLLGLSGGYPLGAATAAEAVRAGTLTRREAEQLLFFCDNTGPAFAVGALGVGIFGSGVIGLWLWVVHALTALLLGSFRNGRSPNPAAAPHSAPMPFSRALTSSVSAAVSSILSIGGYVIFFSALLGAAERFGFPGAAAERAAVLTGLPSAYLRALFIGVMELSSGVGAMAGLPLTPETLALASLLLGWGGLCVHLQSAAVTAPAGIDMRGRLKGKLLHGLLSAALTWVMAGAVL